MCSVQLPCLRHFSDSLHLDILLVVEVKILSSTAACDCLSRERVVNQSRSSTACCDSLQIGFRQLLNRGIYIEVVVLQRSKFGTRKMKLNPTPPHSLHSTCRQLMRSFQSSHTPRNRAMHLLGSVRTSGAPHNRRLPEKLTRCFRQGSYEPAAQKFPKGAEYFLAGTGAYHNRYVTRGKTAFTILSLVSWLTVLNSKLSLPKKILKQNYYQ